MNGKSILALCLVLSALQLGVAHADLVTNGGFESQGATGPDGWITSGDGIAADTIFPATGAYDMSFSSLSTDPLAGTLSQSVGTVARQAYQLTFSLLSETGSPFDTFTVSFGGTTEIITGDMAPFYTSFSYLVPGTDIAGSTTSLTFSGLSDLGSWNLDDVTLEPVSAAIPEPSSAALLFAGMALACGAFAFRGRRALCG